MEEEFVFNSAPSRLDYFKCGVQYEKRITQKLARLHSATIASSVNSNGAAPVSTTAEVANEDGEDVDETGRHLKRAKTQL